MTNETKKLLLVEDNPGDARLIQEMLAEVQGTPFKLTHVDYLSWGLEALSRGGIDLVLLDLVLPDSYGLETFVRVRSHAPEVPIVLLTGLDDETTAIRAVKEGAEDYLVKGNINSKELVRSIRYAIEQHRAKKERLDYVASHDPLTGLPNSGSFIEHLNQYLVQIGRNVHPVAIFYVHLDGLKNVWELFGSENYRAVLLNIVERLKSCIRVTEGTSLDAIARTGEDEFALLLTEISSTQDAVKWARRILDMMSEAIVVSGREFSVACNVGVSLYPINGGSGETLLRKAATAMSQAIAKGKNVFCFYTPEIGIKASDRWELETNLRTALKHNEFSVYYQPVVDLATRRIVAMEALVHWNKDGRLISPMEFIPLAEETGLIIPIGEWALYTACIQNKAWQEMGCNPVCVTVNLSPLQFKQPNLVEMVKTVLKEVGLDGPRLGLEVSESVVMKDIEESISTLRALKETGIRLVVDNFGMDHSSLTYLQRLPVNALKIDRAFMSLVTANYSMPIRAIIAMAKGLKLETIAEGVETTEQMVFLHSLKCDKAQGYLFSRPVPAEEATKLLTNGGGRAYCKDLTNVPKISSKER